MKSVALIILALFIDGIQAGLSAAVFILTAFPGTIGGAAAGCAAGAAVAGDIGCSFGGFLLGLLGSIPLINGALAVATMPVGVILGFAISICVSMTFGAGLVMLLILTGMFYPKYLSGGITELIPGVNCMPFWTALTLASVIRKYGDEKKKLLLPQSLLGQAASGIIATKQQTMSLARERMPNTFIPPQEKARGREENESDPYKGAANQTLRDIRPRHI